MGAVYKWMARRTLRHSAGEHLAAHEKSKYGQTRAGEREENRAPRAGNTEKRQDETPYAEYDDSGFFRHAGHFSTHF